MQDAKMCSLDIRLELLGGLEVRTIAGAPLSLSARKSRALLAYLALARGRAHSRDRLAALLWADSDAEQARSSLRQALTTLRKALAPRELVIADGESVTLALEGWQCDAHEFLRFTEQGEAASLERAAGLYRGDLLEGFDARAPAFDEWLTVERERLRVLAFQVLGRLLEAYERAGNVEAALGPASRLLALDPLREDVHRSLMRLYLRQGRQAAALKQYRLCRAALQRELGVSPEPETERLHREILESRRSGSLLAGAVPERAAGPLAIETRDGPQSAPPIAEAPPGPELRQSTVLFADAVGFDEPARLADPEETHELLSRYREAFNAAVARFGGMVVSHAGTRAMAVFGTPLAHGNESERALRAALVARETVPALAASTGPPLALRLGLASGHVLTTRDEIGLAVSGEPVRVAERIAALAAPQEILLSDRVRQSLRERVDAEAVVGSAPSSDLPTAKLWRARRWREAESMQASGPLVGRLAERRQLAGIVEACLADGRGRIVLLRGEAGMGKSRLAEELAREAGEAGFVCHRLLIFDFGGDADPAGALAASFLGVGAGAATAERGAAVAGALAAGDLDPALAAVARDMLELPQEEGQRADFEAMDTAARTRGRRALLGQLASAAAGRAPILLVVEDIHWADRATLHDLAELAASLRDRPAIVALTTRTESDPVDTAWRAATCGCPLSTIDLGPLTPAESVELAGQHGAGDSAFVRDCVTRAEGNPLFLDQLLRAGENAAGAVPGSLQALVLARLDRLEPADRRDLQAAAVLGQRFSSAALAQLTGEEGDCRRLLDQGLVRREGEDFLFVHALIREAVYAATLKSRRQGWHRQAAAWFAAQDPELAAQHLDAAADPGAAAAYLRAARTEAQRHRHEHAVRCAERGLDLAGDRRLRYALASLRADLLRELGDAAASIAAFREALDLAQGDAEVCRGWLGVAAGLRILDRHREALVALDNAEAAAGGPEGAEALVRICAMRGNIYFPLGELDACLAAHRRVYELAMERRAPEDEAHALGGLGDAWYQRGRMRTAREHFARCVELAGRHGLRRLEVGTRPMLAITDLYCLNLEEALAEGRAALALAVAIGDLRGQLIAHVCSATIASYSGDPGLQAEHAERALALARRLGARRFEAEALALHAHHVQGCVDREAGRRLFAEACALSREVGESYIGPVIRAWAATVEDDPARRRALLAEGESLLEQACVSHCYLHFREQAMSAAAAAADWDEAERHAAALATYTLPEPLPWSDFFIRRTRALVAHAGRADVQSGLALRALRAEAAASGLGGALPLLDRAIDAATDAV